MYFNLDEFLIYLFNLVAGDDATHTGKVEVTEEKLLEMIESAYPNPLTLQDISR